MVLNGYQMVFFGEYSISITDGGRIVIPKKIRENLKGNVFILTKGFDVCLAGYDRDDWLRRTEELRNVSVLDKEHIEKKRFIFSGTTEVGIDEQGRFVVPKNLMDFLSVNRGSLTIVGVGDHFEIWNSQKWHEYISKQRI